MERYHLCIKKADAVAETEEEILCRMLDQEGLVSPLLVIVERKWSF